MFSGRLINPVDLPFSTLYAGTTFTLICEVQLVPEVNTSVTITTSWQRDGTDLISSGRISVDSSATQSDEDSSMYLSMVMFDPLSNQDTGGDDGNYTCSAQIQNDTYITGSTSDGSETLMVEGKITIIMYFCTLF